MDPFVAYSLSMTGISGLFGGLVTFYSVRAARRTGSQALWYLAVGIGCLACGSIATGLLAVVSDVQISGWMGVVNTISAIGFCVLGYSLFVGRPATGR